MAKSVKNNNQLDDKPIDVSAHLEKIFRMSGYGSRSEIMMDNLRGFNMISQGQFIPTLHADSGICFFTRPLLNLTYDNLNRMETLIPWRDADKHSIGQYTRSILDPISTNPNIAKMYLNERMDTIPAKDLDGNIYIKKMPETDYSMIDPTSPFIPCLTNNLLSLSGYQDVRIDHYASDKGIMNEQWIMADGISEFNESLSLDATFLNYQGEVSMLFDLWTKYMDYVRRGEMDPYGVFIARREIDYMTRIYNLVLDSNRQYILRWATTGGGAIPTGVGNGKIYDWASDKSLKEGLENVNIQFQCVGLDYDLMSALMEFNMLVGMYDPNLSLFLGDYSGHPNVTDNLVDNIPQCNEGNNDHVTEKSYIKLALWEKPQLNFVSKPLINLYTKELEWWAPARTYIRLLFGVEFSDFKQWQEHKKQREEIRDSKKHKYEDVWTNI